MDRARPTLLENGVLEPRPGRWAVAGKIAIRARRANEWRIPQTYPGKRAQRRLPTGEWFVSQEREL